MNRAHSLVSLTAVLAAGVGHGAASQLPSEPVPTANSLAVAGGTPNPTTASTPAVAATPLANASPILLTVREKGSGASIRRAEISFRGKKSYTDASGALVLNEDLAPNETVEIQRPGYQPFTSTVAELVAAGGTVFLLPGIRKADTVVITGQDDGSSARRTVSGEEAQRIAPGSDPAKVIRVLPGVQLNTGFGPPSGARQSGRIAQASQSNLRSGGSNADGGAGRGSSSEGRQGTSSQGGVVIRGSPARDSRYFVDDLEAPIIFHTIDDLSVIPGSLLRDVQLDAGNFGVKYGSALGGVVRLGTKNDIPERRKVEVTVNLPYYSGVLGRFPLGGAGDQVLDVSVRRSYIDFFLTPVLEARAEGERKKGKNPAASSPVSAVSPAFADALVSHTQKLANGSRKVTLLAAQDTIGVKLSKGFSGSSDKGFSIDAALSAVTLGVERAVALDDTWSVVSTPQIVYSRSDVAFGENTSISNEARVRAPTEVTGILADGVRLTLGADPSHTWTKDAVRFSGNPFFQESASVTTGSDRLRNWEAAGWSALDLRVGPVRVVPGVRATFQSQIRKTALDPRLNVSLEVATGQTLKASAGRFSMPPSVAESASRGGNPNLEFQRMGQYGVGWDSRWGESITTDLQVYFKDGSRLVTRDLRNAYDNSGQSRGYGLEVFARKALTERASGWFTYTLAVAKERDDAISAYRFASTDQRHVANLVAAYRLTAAWEGSARYKLGTGSTYNPARGGIYDPATDRYANAEPRAEGRLPAQQSVSFSLARDILFDTWKMNLRFGIESLWYENIVSGKRANYDYSTERPQTLLSGIPYLQVKGEL